MIYYEKVLSDILNVSLIVQRSVIWRKKNGEWIPLKNFLFLVTLTILDGFQTYQIKSIMWPPKDNFHPVWFIICHVISEEVLNDFSIQKVLHTCTSVIWQMCSNLMQLWPNSEFFISWHGGVRFYQVKFRIGAIQGSSLLSLVFITISISPIVSVH